MSQETRKVIRPLNCNLEKNGNCWVPGSRPALSPVPFWGESGKGGSPEKRASAGLGHQAAGGLSVTEVILTGELTRTGKRVLAGAHSWGCVVHCPGPAFFVAVPGKPARPQRPGVTRLTDHRPPYQVVCHMCLECGTSGRTGAEHGSDILVQKIPLFGVSSVYRYRNPQRERVCWARCTEKMEP